VKSTSGTLGIGLIAAGVLVAILIGGWLAAGLADDGSDLRLSGALLGAFFGFAIFVLPLVGGGVLILTRARRVAAAMEHVGRQRKMLGIVEASGEISIADLALETGGTRDTVRSDLYDLVSKGLFSGYVDWDRGILFARQASEIRAGGRCPNCGGEQSLAGKGLIRCEYCGAEIFLP
jgi:DNA-directed RNA polymerase subunit RPC12/RpoP